jgi:hypothetical protein
MHLSLRHLQEAEAAEMSTNEITDTAPPSHVDWKLRGLVSIILVLIRSSRLVLLLDYNAKTSWQPMRGRHLRSSEVT